MDKEIRLDFFDSQGNLKPFETFSEELRQVYEQLEGIQADNFIKELTGPQNDYNPVDVLQKFHFVDRKIYLNEEITDEIAQRILQQIQFWNAQDLFNETPEKLRPAIQIYINTPGGDLYATWLIIDCISNSKTPVVTIVTGTAYSGGFFITLAGHGRYAFPHASFMFHQGSTLIVGDAHKALQQSDNYKGMLKEIKKYVLGHTDISPELYDKHKTDDWYFDVKNAIKYNIIDDICTNINGIPNETMEDNNNEG